MNGEQLYPAVITIDRTETIFSDEQLIRLVENDMGAEMGEFLRQRLEISDVGIKQVKRILVGLRSIMEDLEDAENELEDLLP